MPVLNYFYKERIEKNSSFLRRTDRECRVIHNIHHQIVVLWSIALPFEYSKWLQQPPIQFIFISILRSFLLFPTPPACSRALLSYKIDILEDFHSFLFFQQTLLAKPVIIYVCKNPAMIINGTNPNTISVNDQP